VRRRAKAGASILLDLDWKHTLHIAKRDRDMILAQLQVDCAWLHVTNLMDYSLIIGYGECAASETVDHTADKTDKPEKTEKTEKTGKSEKPEKKEKKKKKKEKTGKSEKPEKKKKKKKKKEKTGKSEKPEKKEEEEEGEGEESTCALAWWCLVSGEEPTTEWIVGMGEMAVAHQVRSSRLRDPIRGVIRSENAERKEVRLVVGLVDIFEHYDTYRMILGFGKRAFWNKVGLRALFCSLVRVSLCLFQLS
jgi:Phosphatidylinositol-4-phosphate 5-Kinase